MTGHIDTETLSAYLDGEVGTSERAAVERHLASCPACSARTSALEGAIASVAGLPPLSATETEHRAIRRAVLEGAGAPKVPAAGLPARWSRAWKLSAVTAAVAVLAGIVGVVALRAGRNGGPNTTTSASAPARSASPAVPNLASDADVRSYAQSLPQVRTFLGLPRVEAGAAGSAPVPSPAASAFGQINPPPPASTVPPAASAPSSDRAQDRPVPSVAQPPTLGSCTRAAVPAGAALLEAGPVTYQGIPAWVIAYGSPSGSTDTLNRVVVDVRSQSSCSGLVQTMLAP